ncbi:hypothetical protein GEMRC1_009496 [Eukaryota sp. GEM-RC1]
MLETIRSSLLPRHQTAGRRKPFIEERNQRNGSNLQQLQRELSEVNEYRVLRIDDFHPQWHLAIFTKYDPVVDQRKEEVAERKRLLLKRLTEEVEGLNEVEFTSLETQVVNVLNNNKERIKEPEAITATKGRKKSDRDAFNKKARRD